jgi:short-subunit dehydrogenase
MISEGFVTNGAKVYISSRDAKACEQACKELNALGKGSAHAIPADFYKVEDCKKMAAELAKRETKLDVLVNNSGSNWGAPFSEVRALHSATNNLNQIVLNRIMYLTRKSSPTAHGTES